MGKRKLINVKDEVGNQICNKMNIQMMRLMCNPIVDLMKSQVYDRVGRQVGNQLKIALRSTLYSEYE